jgi:hypothetical protein
MQALNGFGPTVTIDQVVPVGNDVAQGTALMAEGNAAVHATGGLVLLMGRLEGKDIFLPILFAFLDRALVEIFPVLLHESCWFTHFFLRKKI